MNRNVIILLCNILLALFKAQVAQSTTTGCQCLQATKSIPSLKSFEKLEVIFPSASCPRPEIIGIMKDGKEQICLNPDTPTMKIILKTIKKTRS
ncbi:C-X-C motif chemokine 10-like [Gracilinanus agilis]|uniref:C-X-C motif chemokine 10-like n=1 Tax=Gracilinanus agilis TaxID=191870 RepID=UPI001CFE5DA4|nr:C-X-C motif chemokine 10-like [Gracilinanus agilis]